MKRIPVIVLLLVSAIPIFAAEGDSEFRLGKATLRAGNPGRAIEFFEQAATKGNAEAMYFLGLLYEEGKGVAVDQTKAAEWFRSAAEKGHADAMNHYALLLEKTNAAEAVQWHRKSAESGDLHGMNNLADAYYRGAGVQKDLQQAAAWYRKAAGKGHSGAMLTYGYMLSHGEGMPQDVAAAFSMYLAAARAGNSAAMFNIGEYYKAGKGVRKDPTAARFWYLRAAMAGETDAEAEVAALADAPTSSTEGARLLAESERIRNSPKTDAEFAAAKVKAFPLLLQSAETGHLPAIAGLVYAYQYGDGTAKDMVQARTWAQIASEMEHEPSQTMLAQYMLNGSGGPRNTQGARFWFEKASLAGNSLAMGFLARIYDGEFGFPPNEALATYWWIEAYKKGSPTAESVLKERGLLQRDPQAQAFIDRIHQNGPDTSSVQSYTFDVAQYCKYDGPKCHELSVAALKFQRSHNAAAETANLARLWNSNKDPDADRKWRDRSQCMQKKTESIQKHTYGQQDWYYAGSCY
jgi:TPR repeat protein